MDNLHLYDLHSDILLNIAQYLDSHEVHNFVTTSTIMVNTAMCKWKEMWKFGDITLLPFQIELIKKVQKSREITVNLEYGRRIFALCCIQFFKRKDPFCRAVIVINTDDNVNKWVEDAEKCGINVEVVDDLPEYPNLVQIKENSDENCQLEMSEIPDNLSNPPILLIKNSNLKASKAYEKRLNYILPKYHVAVNDVGCGNFTLWSIYHIVFTNYFLPQITIISNPSASKCEITEEYVVGNVYESIERLTKGNYVILASSKFVHRFKSRPGSRSEINSADFKPKKFIFDFEPEIDDLTTVVDELTNLEGKNIIEHNGTDDYGKFDIDVMELCKTYDTILIVGDPDLILNKIKCVRHKNIKVYLLKETLSDVWNSRQNKLDSKLCRFTTNVSPLSQVTALLTIMGFDIIQMNQRDVDLLCGKIGTPQWEILPYDDHVKGFTNEQAIVISNINNSRRTSGYIPQELMNW